MTSLFSSGPRSVRIAPVDDLTAEQKDLLEQTILRPGEGPPNLFKVLVRHPTLMKRTNVLAGMFMSKALLPVRDREIAILRVAARTGCEYEYAQHLKVALRSGLNDDDVDVVSGVRSEDHWNEDDRVLVRFIDSLVDGFEVPEILWSQVNTRYSDEQLLELTMLAGFYRMLACLMNTVGIPLDQVVRPRDGSE